MKRPRSDRPTIETYMPISRVHVTPNDGAEFDGSQFRQAVNHGSYITVSVEVDGIADTQQNYNLQFASAATPLPLFASVSVFPGSKYSTTFGFSAPNMNLPNNVTITATHSGTPFDQVSVIVRCRAMSP